MVVSKESFNGCQAMPIESELFDARIIFMEGEIKQETANEVAKEIMYLVMTGNEPISLVINSPGGDVDAGLKICDAISTCPCQVNAYCFGQAYSMGAIIFEAVNGKRYMFKHSRLMIHQPSISTLNNRTASDVSELSRQMEKKADILLEIVSVKSGIKKSVLKKETQVDRFYDAKEAVALGLADKCVGIETFTNHTFMK